MEHRNFGNTDLKCSVVGFGTWEMGATQYGAIGTSPRRFAPSRWPSTTASPCSIDGMEV